MINISKIAMSEDMTLKELHEALVKERQWEEFASRTKAIGNSDTEILFAYQKTMQDLIEEEGK